MSRGLLIPRGYLHKSDVMGRVSIPAPYYHLRGLKRHGTLFRVTWQDDIVTLQPIREEEEVADE